MRLLHRLARGACLVLLASGCMRYETAWSGVQMIDAGKRLELAAEPGLCTCATLVNKSGSTILLVSQYGDLDLGRATLAARQRMSVRFDSAGDGSHDAYILEAFTPDGQPLDAEDVLDVREQPGSRPCSAAACAWGALNMRLVTRDPAK